MTFQLDDIIFTDKVKEEIIDLVVNYHYEIGEAVGEVLLKDYYDTLDNISDYLCEKIKKELDE